MNVSVLLATYNGEKYLSEQLNSLLAQTYQDFNLIIHDDGSTDGTLEIIEEYRKKYSDKIKVLYGNSTGSAKTNFMWMLKQIEADYYFLCDQDDVWFNDKIEKSLAEVQNIEKEKPGLPVAVFTDMQVVDAKLNKISDSFIRYIGRDYRNVAYTQILIDNPAAGCTMCFNRKLRDIAISGQNINWENVPMHDAWILELAAVFGEINGIDMSMVYYRQTGNNTMGAETESKSDKLSRNVKLAESGNFFEKKHTFINEARNFAKEIMKIDAIPDDKYKVLKEFVNIGNKPKLYRINFYKKYNFTRANHNAWMRLWV